MDKPPVAGPRVCDSVLLIDAQADEVRRASSWLCERCRELTTPPTAIARLELCLNEVLANIVTHGTATALDRPIEIHLLVQGDLASGAAHLTIFDSGVAFDPSSYLPAPLPSSLAEVEIGGLGVSLIRHNSDSLDYTRSEGRNVLKLGFRWPQLDHGRR